MADKVDDLMIKTLNKVSETGNITTGDIFVLKYCSKQLDELQQVYGMARKMGLRNFNVPDRVWEEARQAIGGVASNQLRPNSGSDWF